MKKFIWALMVAAAATFTFSSCDEKIEPEQDKPNNEQPTPDQPGNEEPTPDQPGNEEPAPEQPAAPEWCTSLFAVDFTIDETAGYGFAEFDYSALTNAEGQTIHEYLGFESWEALAEALGTIDEAKAFDRDVQLFGIDLGSETDIIEPYNNNGWGYWVDANGVKDAWGSETVRAYTEAYSSEETGYLAPTCIVGVMPGNIAEGDIYKFGMVFQKTGDEVLRAGVQITIKVEAFVDPLKSQFPSTATAGTFDVNIEGEISLSALTSGYELISWDEPVKTVFEKLGMTPYEFGQFPAPTLDDDGEVYVGLSKPAVEYWFDANNEVVSWSDDGSTGNVICIKWYYGPDYYGSGACVMPGTELFYTDAVAACVGKTFNATFTFTYIPDVNEDMLPDQDATVVNLNMAVTIVE